MTMREARHIRELLLEHPLIQRLITMNKTKTTEPMTMKMTIELADNGIILRNPDCEDDVTLAIEKGSWTDSIDKSDEYNAIGKRVLDWLMDVVLGETSPQEVTVTGFDIDINARCTGR